MSLLRHLPFGAAIGLVITVSMVLAAILAPWVAPYPGSQVLGGVWEPASAQFPLGSDNLGRDLLSRLIYGGRTTIFIAFMATALAFTLGSVLGFTAAVFGGWVDQVMSRLVDLLMSIPTLIFALVILSVLPSTIPILILVMGILDSTREIGRAHV